MRPRTFLRRAAAMQASGCFSHPQVDKLCCGATQPRGLAYCKLIAQLILCGVFMTGNALAQSPRIDLIRPLAAIPGETTRFTFTGENLGGATELWTSFPARSVPASSSDAAGKETTFLISVPRDVPPGIGAIRLAATNGISSLHLVFVDDLPAGNSVKNHHSPETAAPISFPIAVDGNCESFKTNYYRFQAARHQQFTIEVLAHRLGSALDPVVRVLDLQGKELAFCDDEPGSGPDPRFAWTAPDAGDYLLEIRDLHYSGGPNYFYRLRLGAFPLATVPYPLALQHDSISELRFLGPYPGALEAAIIQAPSASARWKPLGITFAQGTGSGWVSLLGNALPDWLEVEPNNRPEGANSISLPVSIHGRFEAARDRDYFQFKAANGDRFTFAARSRTLGSPCDVFMRLTDAAGTVLAESNVPGTDDPSLTHRFSKDGTYFLRVEELNLFGGPDLAYVIEARPFQPGFSLNVETEKLETSQGAPVELKINAVRREYDGPITLALAGAGAEFLLENGIIPEKKAETTLKITPPAAWNPGRLQTFQIVGSAVIQNSEYTARVSTMPALRKLFPLIIYPPEHLDGTIALGITPANKVSEKPTSSDPAQ